MLVTNRLLVEPYGMTKRSVKTSGNFQKVSRLYQTLLRPREVIYPLMSGVYSENGKSGNGESETSIGDNRKDVPLPGYDGFRIAIAHLKSNKMAEAEAYRRRYSNMAAKS